MEGGEQLNTLEVHTDYVSAALFSPKANTVLTASKDGLAVLWDFTSGAQVHQLQGHSLAINCAVMSEDGERC